MNPTIVLHLALVTSRNGSRIRTEVTDTLEMGRKQTFYLLVPNRLGIISAMLCQTNTQLHLEGLVENRALPQSAERPKETVVSEEVINKREYHRKWEQEHKDRTKAYHLRKYAKDKDRLKEKRSTPKHKENRREYMKQYRAKHLEHARSEMKKWAQENKPRIKEYRHNYGARRRELYQKRKEAICTRKRELSKMPKYLARVQDYQRRRRREDPLFALIGVLRATTNRAFRRQWIEKPARTEALLGCTIEEAKAHISSQFTGDMSWSNRVSFEIDHHVPVEAFNLRDSEEVALAFNWRNLRPITPHENAVKSDTIPSPLPTWLPPEIASRITNRRQSFGI